MPRAIDQPGNRLPRQSQDSPTPQDKDKKKKRNTLLTALAITLVIAIVAGVGYYLIYFMPFQRVIIKVGNDAVRIDYFLKRVLNNPNGQDIWSTMETVTYELVIKQEAPNYGINITDADIDKALRDAAQGTNESITDAEFNEWYRQQLNYSTYSKQQFREVVKRSLEMRALGQVLSDRVPNTAEQGHLWSIIVSTYDEAVAVKKRADNGEDFKILAKELSIDTSTKDKGGEMGWVPFDVLDSPFSSIVYGLDIGVCSDPVMVSQPDPSSTDPSAQNPPYVVFMVSEKDVAREVTADQLQILKGKALKDWLNNEMNTKTIEFHGLHGTGGYDSETEAWLSYQLQRMTKAISGSTSTSTSTSTTQGQATP